MIEQSVELQRARDRDRIDAMLLLKFLGDKRGRDFPTEYSTPDGVVEIGLDHILPIRQQ